MTTRKTIPTRWRSLLVVAGLSTVALGGGGCATPGVLHVYSVAPSAVAVVHDAGGEAAAEVPSFIAPGEQLTGFAYDPYTDHFFLRLAPGNAIRVVDRPARAIKREFVVAGLPETGGGDLTLRPRDGHVFLLHPIDPAVVEITRLGKWVRTFGLGPTTFPAVGIAYDPKHDTLFVLQRGEQPVITVHTMNGRQIHTFMLDRAVMPSLGFDAEKRELYAPLAGATLAVGVFDESGRLQRTIASPDTFIDVGPRSLVRVF